MQESLVSRYFDGLAKAISDTACTDQSGKPIEQSDGVALAIQYMRDVAETRNRVLFCGNGGSAGICSHMATDFFKNGGVPALALNDSSALTCLANDFGYEFVFSKQIEMLSKAGDMLIAISSSGQSKNILNGVEAARKSDCRVMTFSGFKADNPLRMAGDLNFHVPATDYGFVEAAHLSLLSAILDIHMDWPNIEYPT